MKFKGIFAVFNAITIFSFLFIFLMPLFVLDIPSYFIFASRNIYLALVFMGILALMNMYFILNWKMFVLLEREDWPALNTLLAEKIFIKGQYSARNVKLFVNTALLQSDVASLDRLESELRAKRPSLISKNAALFGVTHLLKPKGEESLAFFREYAKRKDVKDREWICFDLAFSLIQSKQWDEAVTVIMESFGGMQTPILKGMTLYVFESARGSVGSEKKEICDAFMKKQKSDFTAKYGKHAWETEAERSKGAIHVIILSRLIDDAGVWLYP